MARINKQTVARVLVDANALGDEAAARKHGVSVRSVERYRARMREDPELAGLVATKNREAEAGWHAARSKTLRTIMRRLEELAKDEKDIDKLSRAAKAVGDIDVASSALNVGTGADPASQATPEDPDDGGEVEEPSIQ